MLTLPETIMALMIPFAPVFQERTWVKAQVLVVGAILATGKRTVSAALRVMGLSGESQFSKYHHVLNRAVWSSLELSQVLLELLVSRLAAPDEPLVFGIDETIERRWGKKIRARGIYRDPVRSSKSHLVKASGLRWVSMMLLTKVPWAQRVWGLPFLTVLAPSERYYDSSPRAPKKLTDWARQMIFQLRRWLPQRDIVVVGDGSYAVIDLLNACRSLTKPVTFITRLRLDAALYEPAPPYAGRGRPRVKGKRLPTLEQVLKNPTTMWAALTLPWYNQGPRTIEFTSNTAVWYHSGKAPVPIRWILIRDPLGEFEPQALLCTDLDVAPLQVLQWFMRRWQLEVTFQEVRAHLGVETQRQWSDLAIARTTPALFGLFSWVTLLAHSLFPDMRLPVRTAAWYAKELPTFADAIALVRSQLWTDATFRMSSDSPDMVEIPRPLLKRLVDTVCYAA